MLFFLRYNGIKVWVALTCAHVLWSPHASDHWCATEVTTAWLN